MEKSKFVKLYFGLSLPVIIALLIVNLTFLGSMPNELTYPLGYFGTVTKGLFSIQFESTDGVIDVFNWPLVVTLILFAFSVFVAVIALTKDKVKGKVLQDGVVYNCVILFLVIVSNIVYTFMLPDTMSGVIVHKLFYSQFEILADQFRTAFNLSFVLLFIYLILNIAFIFGSTNVVTTEDKNFKEKDLNL